ncbi:hypothetical protein SAY87_011414 [Trapa incisa]|nr:hypothetical protein SAY87_011414 [Trapa incisa]
MSFLLPNLSPALLHPKSKDRASSSPCSSSASSPCSLLPSKTLSARSIGSLPPLSLSAPTSLQSPTSEGSQLSGSDGTPDKRQKDDFYINLGLAVRTLREDMPLIFSKDLNYEIYRDDITFLDPLNTFTGIENYKLIFWALRFHGKILFREISLEVFRVWQPSENMILIRWNLKGVPRVPWEAQGQFQGTSRYKLDRNGKIYEHKVDNLAFNFPQPSKPAVSVLDLVAACPASPNPTFLWGPAEAPSSSWVEFYRAVRETLDGEGSILRHEGLITCT